MNAPSIDIHASTDGHALRGELTIRNVSHCRDVLLPLPAGTHHRLDLSGVSIIDGAGLQLLMLMLREASRQGTQLEFVAPSRAVETALAMARMQAPVAA